EYLRGWAVQMGLEDRHPATAFLDKLAALAEKDPSAFVRLYLASALQRLPFEQRWSIAEGLVAHGEDSNDPNLPLMVWYGIEPLVAADQERFVGLIAKSKVPLLREFIARRVAMTARDAADATRSELQPLVRLLHESQDAVTQRDVLRGMHEAL